MMKAVTKARGERIHSLSPWVLGGALLLLVTMLVLFSLSNYQREKNLILDGLGQRGYTILRFIDTAVRDAMQRQLKAGAAVTPWPELLQNALNQVAEQPGVNRLAIVGSGGETIVAAGDWSGELSPADKLARVNRTFFDNHQEFITQQSEDGSQVLVAGRFLTSPQHRLHRHMGGMGRWAGKSMMMQRFSGRPDLDNLRQDIELFVDSQPVLLLELDFRAFDQGLSRQLLQIFLLLTAICLVGLGSYLSLVTLRGLRQSELRLSRQEALTERLVARLPVGVISCDSQGHLQLLNQAALRILEPAETTIVGSHARQVLPAELAGAMLGEAAAEFQEIDLQFHNPSGTARLVQAIVFPITAEAKQEKGDQAVVALLRDMTEIRRLERALLRSERLASLGRVAGGVAHELRNPLSSIKGLALLLQKGSLNSQELASTELLINEVERLDRSVEELLDLARPARLELAATDLRSLVDKAIALLESDIQGAAAQVVVKVKGELQSVLADGDKITQVLLNLLINALQAVAEKGLVEVMLEPGEDGIVIAIRDNGVGIDSKVLPRIFDPYFTTKPQGTGLGLALSAKIVEEHGGRLEAESRLGEFTMIRMHLPWKADQLSTVDLAGR